MNAVKAPGGFAALWMIAALVFVLCPPCLAKGQRVFHPSSEDARNASGGVLLDRAEVVGSFSRSFLRPPSDRERWLDFDSADIWQSFFGASVTVAFPRIFSSDASLEVTPRLGLSYLGFSYNEGWWSSLGKYRLHADALPAIGTSVKISFGEVALGRGFLRFDAQFMPPGDAALEVNDDPQSDAKATHTRVQLGGGIEVFLHRSEGWSLSLGFEVAVYMQLLRITAEDSPVRTYREIMPVLFLPYFPMHLGVKSNLEIGAFQASVGLGVNDVGLMELLTIVLPLLHAVAEPTLELSVGYRF